MGGDTPPISLYAFTACTGLFLLSKLHHVAVKSPQLFVRAYKNQKKKRINAKQRMYRVLCVSGDKTDNPVQLIIVMIHKI
jgi:hypothetical protein